MPLRSEPRRLRYPITSAAALFGAALVVVALCGWQILRSREAQLADARKDAMTLGHSLAQHAERSVEAIDLILSGSIERIEGNPERTTLTRYLTRRAGTVAQVRMLAFIDPGGVWTHDSMAPHLTMRSDDRPFFTWHRDHPEDHGMRIGTVMESPADGRPMIPLTRRVNASDGSFAGIILAALDPAFFSRFYATIGLGRGGAIALWSSDGRLLARHPVIEGSIGRDFSERPLFQAVRQSPFGVYDAPPGPLDGIARILAYERLDRYPALMVSAALATEEALAPWRRDALTQAATVATAAFALIVLGLRLARRDRRVLAAQAEARENAARLSATLETMDQGLMMVGPDHRIEVCNGRALELLDLPPSLLAGRPTTETVLARQWAAGEFEGASEPTRALMASGGTGAGRHLYERTRPNGTVLEVRSVPTAEGGLVRTYTDITARHAAETARRDSEARYRLLAESTSDVITHLRLPDFQRIYVSPACRNLFGCEPEEMLGHRPSVSNMHPDDAPTVRTRAAHLAAGDCEHDRVTYRAQHKNGRWIWVEAGLNLARDETSGAPAMIVCSLRDVTERRRQAEELEAARIAAEAGARAKSEFLANMSHELRTPLTGMLGVHDLLQGEPDLTERQRHLVALAQESGRSLLTIVNDILDFSKIEAGHMTIEARPFSVRELVGSVRELGTGASGGTGTRVALLVEIGAEVPDLFVGDETRIRQVLLNLVTNAMKFTLEGQVVVRAFWMSGRLRVEVSDTGIGIAQDAIGQLFERFSQADGSTTRRFGGTGLGLAICKRLVELMRGRIGVESQPERGSTFWFELQLVPADRALPAADEPPTLVPDPAGRRWSILLAEDNAINQQIITAALDRRGHAVMLATDGTVAADLFRRYAFDIVLMDIQMPGTDGFAATAEIRAFEDAEGRRPTPVVALTANAGAAEAERCRAAGMDAHVTKPIDWPELFATIDRMCAAAQTAPLADDDAAAEAPAIFDERVLDELAALLGPDRVAGLVTSFRSDAVRRLDLLAAPTATVAELEAQAHALTSSAGQLGFAELSRTCAELEELASTGSGLDRIGALRTVAERALAAAERSTYAKRAAA